MTSATSFAKSHPAPARDRAAVASRVVRSVRSFGALCVEMARLARDLEAASTDQERRQLARRPLGLPRAA